MRYSTIYQGPIHRHPQGPPHKIDSHFGEHYDFRTSGPLGGLPPLLIRPPYWPNVKNSTAHVLIAEIMN